MFCMKNLVCLVICFVISSFVNSSDVIIFQKPVIGEEDITIVWTFNNKETIFNINITTNNSNCDNEDYNNTTNFTVLLVPNKTDHFTYNVSNYKSSITYIISIQADNLPESRKQYTVYTSPEELSFIGVPNVACNITECSILVPEINNIGCNSFIYYVVLDDQTDNRNKNNDSTRLQTIFRQADKHNEFYKWILYETKLEKTDATSNTVFITQNVHENQINRSSKMVVILWNDYRGKYKLSSSKHIDIVYDMLSSTNSDKETIQSSTEHMQSPHTKSTTITSLISTSTEFEDDYSTNSPIVDNAMFDANMEENIINLPTLDEPITENSIINSHMSAKPIPMSELESSIEDNTINSIIPNNSATNLHTIDPIEVYTTNLPSTDSFTLNHEYKENQIDLLEPDIEENVIVDKSTDIESNEIKLAGIKEAGGENKDLVKVSNINNMTTLIIICGITLFILIVVVFIRRDDLRNYRFNDTMMPLLRRRNNHQVVIDMKVCGDDININDVEKYIKDCHRTGSFQESFMKFKNKRENDILVGLLPENKLKNRYTDILPYDSTRVVLEKIHGIEDSNYINANYIPGYQYDENGKRYIATQGPKPSTINDFWRMVWQEETEIIVMVTALKDGSNKKCEQYWPNPDFNKTYGAIEVENVEENRYMDYTHRYFEITKNGETRNVQQLHFLTWPDKSVPNQIYSLVGFLQNIRQLDVNLKPIVIHCSAGVGRTGVIILCDYLIDMAEVTSYINFEKGLKLLRDCRCGMVQTEDQYKLIHIIIWEYFRKENLPSIPWFRVDEILDNMGELNDRIFKILNGEEWFNSIMTNNYDITTHTINRKKIRYPEFIQSTGVRRSRIELTYYPHDDETSNYINAHKAFGYMNRRFITTQLPLPNTLKDFWRLVSSQDVTKIFFIQAPPENDEFYVKCWPNSADECMEPVDYITLEFKNIEINGFYDITTINVHNKNTSADFEVTIYSFKHWPCDQLVPGHKEFVSYYEEYESLIHDDIIILACSNGLTGCGLFLCLHFLLTKRNAEGEFDALWALRYARNSCSMFMTENEQVEFLYKAATTIPNSEIEWIENDLYDHNQDILNVEEHSV